MNFLLLPGFLVLLLTFYVPLAVIVGISFASRIPGSFLLEYWPPSFENYVSVFDPLYLNVLVTTARVIGISTAVTLLIGFPMALFIHRQGSKTKQLLLVMLMIPFFANFLARVYAWFIILKPNGVLETLQIGGGNILNTEAALVIGIVSTYLPFLVYPIYFSLERIDKNLFDASLNLGASSFEILFKIIIPLSTPGIVAGVIMVALPALGEFIIAKMVGGGLIPLAAMVIETSFLGKVTPNWPFGAALSVIVMMCVMIGLTILRRSTTDRYFAAH